jgi:hypothetical protein
MRTQFAVYHEGKGWSFSIPPLNFNASDYMDLILWQEYTDRTTTHM